MTNKHSKEFDYFWSALMFYTRIPVPNGALHSQEVLNKSLKYFPLIGILVGAIAATVFLLANQVFSVALSVALSMIASLLATGAFHEDGFADSCDGFGGGWSPQQVLTIMKDSRIGTYAAVGLIFLLGLKFLALLDIANTENTVLFFSIYVAAHTLSRSLSSTMIGLFDYVQDIDESKIKPIAARNLTPSEKLVSIAFTTLAILFAASSALATTLIASLAATIIAFGFMAYSRHRIGGYTGDVLGAIQQLSELTFYLCFAATL